MYLYIYIIFRIYLISIAMDTDTGFANVRRSGRISNRKEHCVLCESGRCIEDQNNGKNMNNKGTYRIITCVYFSIDDYYTDEDITSAEQSPKVKRKKARKPSTYVPTGKPRGRPRKHFVSSHYVLTGKPRERKQKIFRKINVIHLKVCMIMIYQFTERIEGAFKWVKPFVPRHTQ